MAQAKQLPSSEHAPAQPSYLLRGHNAQIHAVHFLRGNTRLLTGDAEGWVVLWSISTKRAAAVWKPHRSTVLGLGSWDDDKIITHGRDSKIHVWQLREEDEKDFCKVLPIESQDTTEHKQPWLLYTLPVNSLNFCSFALVHARQESHDLPKEGILLATPGLKDGSVNLTSLPSQQRIATILPPAGESPGMIMAIGFTFTSSPQTSSGTNSLLTITGYESGQTCIYTQPPTTTQPWTLIYKSKPHSQPILSLAISPSNSSFFTSSADAIIARHPLQEGSTVMYKTIQTKHAGQQGLQVRNDEKIFATAGWDGRMRVYSVKSMREVAVLKWHKEGCYAIAFAEVGASREREGEEGRQDEEKEGRVARRQLPVAQQREERARTTHWLAAGSKDGKVSLWDIY